MSKSKYFCFVIWRGRPGVSKRSVCCESRPFARYLECMSLYIFYLPLYVSWMGGCPQLSPRLIPLPTAPYAQYIPSHPIPPRTLCSPFFTNLLLISKKEDHSTSQNAKCLWQAWKGIQHCKQMVVVVDYCYRSEKKRKNTKLSKGAESPPPIPKSTCNHH